MSRTVDRDYKTRHGLEWDFAPVNVIVTACQLNLLQ